MPYLVSPIQVQQSIGGLSGNQSTTTGTETIKLTAMMDSVHSRIEELLNVRSLERLAYVDTFGIPSGRRRSSESLRLTAGFVRTDAPIQVLDSFGDALNEDLLSVDHENGIINVNTTLSGTYKVSYVAGFAVANESIGEGHWQVYADAPQWLSGIVYTLAVQWFRVVALRPNLPDNVNYRALLDALYREVAARIYSRYMRPRFDVHFPRKMVVTPFDADAES